jgi:hypothetical protein
MKAMMAAVVALACLAVGAARADMEMTEVDAPIVSVGLFKNGLALVTRKVTVPEAGTYVVTDVPTPVHGTFWIESDAEVEARCTTRETETELPAPAGADLQDDLAGRHVTVTLRDGNGDELAGTVLAFEQPSSERGWDRDYQPEPSRYWRSYNPLQPQPVARSRFLVLQTDDGLIYVDPASIAYLQADPGPGKRTETRPVLLLDVEELTETPGTVTITYLAKGMAWSPSYRVDISDPETLTLTQKAVLRNELGDIEDAEVSLISGFPSVEFMHVDSPLSAGATWAAFFSQLSRRPEGVQNILSNVATQQAVAAPLAVSLTDLGAAALPTGGGPDIHYHGIGRRSLAEGDSLALTVAHGQAGYERIVEWLVPDTRTASGQYVREYERERNPDKYRDAAWDALLFGNPLDFPMTTAPAMVVAGGRFLGQRTSFWANAGEQTTIHITKALSIRTRSVENEEAEARQRLMIAGDDYQRTNVRGELSLTNNRAETVKVVIRRRFSGDLIEADGDPECTLMEEGVYSINQRNEAVWTITLEPGESRTLTYRYSVLVDV